MIDPRFRGLLECWRFFSMSREHFAESVELTPLQKQLVRDTLREILRSPQFSKSKRYPALLEYIVTHTLSGESDALRERNLAAAVFDRPASYDPGADAIVRTIAGEVRRRMAVYFSEHPEAPVRIDLPLGSYVAEFRFPSPGANATLPGGPQAALDGAFDQEFPPAATPRIQVLPQRAHRTFGIATLVVVLVALAASAIWNRAQNARRQSFWWPVLHNDAPALVFVGGDPDPHTAPGTPNASAPDTRPRDFNLLTMGNTIATAKVCDAFRAFGRDCPISAARLATSQDVRNNTAILIGAFDNPLTNQFLSAARYQFQISPPDTPAPAEATLRRIVDTSNPGANSAWAVGPESGPVATGIDYAVLARFRSDINDGYAVVIAGLSPAGTESAAEYASSPAGMRETIASAPKNWAGFNFEAVLEINLVAGNPGHVRVVAAQFW